MIDLTDAARVRFDAYLSRLRSALRGTPRVAADEVEQNVCEHIEVALAGTPAPVGAEHLGAVLDRLGPPERWLPEEELPAWRRWLERLRTGPEEWRLAYLAFGFFVAMVIFMPLGGILLLIPAYLLSRAYVSLLAEQGEEIGARKWLVYPAIVVVLLIAGFLVLIGPVAPLLNWAFDEGGLAFLMANSAANLEGTRVAVGLVLISFGAWWVLASGLLALLHRPIQIMGRPLLDDSRRKHLWFLTLAGALLGGAGAAVVFA
ncbi:MAG TPA: hypothetical protein VNA04_10470 [Thermoanaerobaculia bacterium]|nr:hypothetical protein [Thermoanaerobaculia bacterium]